MAMLSQADRRLAASTVSGLTPLSRAPGGAAARIRDNNFDALRLIFASIVVFFHISVLSGLESLEWIHRYMSATFAVQAFFVVSGFLVTMSCESSSSLRSYASKRFRRIAPAYVTVVVAAVILLSFMSALPARQYFSHPGLWRYLAYNLILSNFEAPDLPGVFQSNPVSVVNASLWTIKVEVGFYLVVPIMVWAIRRFGYRKILGGLFLASLAWRVGLQELASLGAGEIYARLAKQLPGQLSFFVGGAWAYYRAREGLSPPVVAAILGLVIYAMSSGIFDTLSAPFAVTALVSWAAIAGPRMPRAGQYGDFSYGVYLYHFPIVQTCIAWGLFEWSAGMAVMIVVALVLVCSVLSWFLIEAPALAGRAVTLPRPRASLTP